MAGPISRYARILLVIALLVGLAGGLIYFWPSGDDGQTTAANQAQTAMLTAKQEAVEAGSPSLARSLFSRGLAAEQRGDRLRSEGQSEKAADAFRSAARYYQQALAAADSLVAARARDSLAEETAVSAAELRQIHRKADSIRAQMLRQKKKAQQARAGDLASELYEEALTASTAGRRAYQQDTYEGYVAARTKFSRASELFQTAAELSSDRHAAVTRRKAVEQLRSQIQQPPALPRVNKLVQRAESLRAQAEAQYERENYSQAAHLLEDVGMMYTRIQSIVDSVHSAEARAAAQAENRTAAEEARQAARAARERLSDTRRQHSLYEKTRSLEREAQRLYEREEYVRAAEHFQRVEQQLRKIQEMPLPLDQAREVVHELVGRYQQALEEKDVYQLQELVPGLDAHWWSDFFEGAQNLMVSVDTGTLERTSDGATISVRVRVDYMDGKNRMENETFRNVWTLKPDNGHWSISNASTR